MVETEGRDISTTANPMLLRIRTAALDKAFLQVRKKRLDLDDQINRRCISEEDYQKELVKLILEGNEIRVQKKELEAFLEG